MQNCFCFDIYGVRFKIKIQESVIEDIKRLFAPFLVRCKGEKKDFYTFECKPISSHTKIASLINPLLAKNGIWGFHGSGVVYKKKTIVFLGKSGSGKTTIARIFLKLGFKIIGDDIILMREKENAIEVMPFFYGIQRNDKLSIEPLASSNFSHGMLFNMFILSDIKDRTIINGPLSNKLLRKEIYKNILWALDKYTIKKQLDFIEKLVLNGAYYIILGHDILKKEKKLIKLIEQIWKE